MMMLEFRTWRSLPWLFSVLSFLILLSTEGPAVFARPLASTAVPPACWSVAAAAAAVADATPRPQAPGDQRNCDLFSFGGGGVGQHRFSFQTTLSVR